MWPELERVTAFTSTVSVGILAMRIPERQDVDDGQNGSRDGNPEAAILREADAKIPDLA